MSMRTGLSPKGEDKEKLQDVEQVVRELKRLGVDISTGTLEVSNKPKINSNNGG